MCFAIQQHQVKINLLPKEPWEKETGNISKQESGIGICQVSEGFYGTQLPNLRLLELSYTHIQKDNAHGTAPQTVIALQGFQDAICRHQIFNLRKQSFYKVQD